jgi:microcystin-dependent protein
MLKKILFFVAVTVLPALAIAQPYNNVGIGTTTPDPSAVLDVTSSNPLDPRGILIPRLNTLQRLAIPTPAVGLMAYDTDQNLFYFFNGTIWVALSANTASVPTGLISMWSGPINTIPAGWALCDGSSGTPDLRNRFILSVQSSVENPGGTGGTHDQSLTVANLPLHDHTIDHAHTIADPGHNHTSVLTNSATQGTGSLYGDNSSTNGSVNVSTNSSPTGITVNQYTGSSGQTGSGTTFDNRPAFYKLAFIMKL